MQDIKIIKNFLSKGVSDFLFDHLRDNVTWYETLNVIGTYNTKKIKRKMSYFSITPEIYEYANLSFQGDMLENGDPLSTLIQLLAFEDNYVFNSVLLNYYKDGKDEINWHSDKEESLGEKPIIACVNLGATRKFWFREKDSISDPFFYEVSHGDLLVMGQDCQSKYLHAIKKESEVTESRISLTFRYNY